MVPPYPYCIEEDHHAVPLEDCWYARPQLFFKCVLRPNLKHERLVENRTYKTGPDDIACTFSTFEELKLPMNGPVEDSGMVKLYEPSPTPCLYVVPAENMVGRGCPSRRLQRGRMLRRMQAQACSRHKNSFARQLQPDSK